MPRNDLPARLVFGAICIGLLVIAPDAHAETKFVAIYDATIAGEVHRIIDTSPHDSRAACNLSAEVALEHARVVPWNVKPEQIEVICQPLEWPE